MEDIKYVCLEDQQMMNFFFFGKYIFGKLKVNWLINYVKVLEDRFNECYYEIVIDGMVFVFVNFLNLEELLIFVFGIEFINFFFFWELSEIIEEF